PCRTPLSAAWPAAGGRRERRAHGIKDVFGRHAAAREPERFAPVCPATPPPPRPPCLSGQGRAASPQPDQQGSHMYKDVQLFINGEWTASASGRTIDVINPATEEVIGKIAHADRADLDRALEAASKGFETWRNMSAFERSKIMRRAADLLRERAEEVARLMTMEQGKPLAEAKMETLGAADTIDWFAEEPAPLWPLV
ncbi:succinate semialdehyde dehydrogenase, putative, partial [Ricinus communis]